MNFAISSTVNCSDDKLVLFLTLLESWDSTSFSCSSRLFSVGLEQFVGVDVQELALSSLDCDSDFATEIASTKHEARRRKKINEIRNEKNTRRVNLTNAALTRRRFMISDAGQGWPRRPF